MFVWPFSLFSRHIINSRICNGRKDGASYWEQQRGKRSFDYSLAYFSRSVKLNWWRREANVTITSEILSKKQTRRMSCALAFHQIFIWEILYCKNQLQFIMVFRLGTNTWKRRNRIGTKIHLICIELLRFRLDKRQDHLNFLIIRMKNAVEKCENKWICVYKKSNHNDVLIYTCIAWCIGVVSYLKVKRNNRIRTKCTIWDYTSAWKQKTLSSIL